MSKLKLSQNKTVLLAIPFRKADKISLTFKVQGEEIKSSNQLKILGCILNNEGNSVSDLNRTLRICYNTLENIKKARKYISNDLCGIFMKSFVLSRLNYMSLCYINLPAYHLNRIHKLVMSCARISRNSFGYKIRCSDILNEFKMLNHQQLLFKSAFGFIFKLINNKQPSELYDMINMPTRNCKNVTLKKQFISCANARKINILPSLVHLYNEHHRAIKSECPRKQLKEITKYTRASPERVWLAGLSRL